MAGLSPRVRGNPGHPQYPSRQRRSIPACAGKPLLPGSRRPNRAVYPRVCGETEGRVYYSPTLDGLSPRVRGNLVTGSIALSKKRSIPACAGKPRCSGVSVVARWVYPRVCGETLPVFKRYAFKDGLSPRVRGNRASTSDQGLPVGSIPACAGKPKICPPARSITSVYPRVCGETLLSLSIMCFASGLSPRVRGNLIIRTRAWAALGSIPACAGKPHWV